MGGETYFNPFSICAAPITPQSCRRRRQSSHAFVIALKLGSILRHFKYCAGNVFDLIEAALYSGYNSPQWAFERKFRSNELPAKYTFYVHLAGKLIPDQFAAAFRALIQNLQFRAFAAANRTNAEIGCAITYAITCAWHEPFSSPVSPRRPCRSRQCENLPVSFRT